MKGSETLTAERIDRLTIAFQDLAKDVRQALARLEAREARGEISSKGEFFEKMRTCAEVERYFRLQRHTVLKAARAGLIPAARRSRCGRESFLIDPHDAFKEWGSS